MISAKELRSLLLELASELLRAYPYSPSAVADRLLVLNDRARAAAAELNQCHSHRDGECYWELCPQIRDREPSKSGRHCPLDIYDEEGELRHVGHRAAAAELGERQQWPTKDDLAAAKADFAEYFRRNYPGPDTIIHKPDWHAPKLFNAAVRPLLARFGGGGVKLKQ